MKGDGYLMGAFGSFILGIMCLLLVLSSKTLVGSIVLIICGVFILLFGYFGIYLYKHMDGKKEAIK
jgi:hypothetical protein